MTNISPAARAVLEAVTWKRYDVPPEGLPGFALEMAPLIATALRAAASQITSTKSGDRLCAIANELDELHELGDD